MPLISYIIPTHRRPEELQLTLDALALLPGASRERDEIIVVENEAADDAADHAGKPPTRAGDIPVRWIRNRKNDGAAARNLAAKKARGDWLFMLDDDAAPLQVDASVLEGASDDVGAIGAEIFLDPDADPPRREAGGLPEVFVGCGAAIRRDVFLELGGYDASFVYYVEEYDFCAKLIASGRRVTWSNGFRVHHRRASRGRDLNVILRRLIVNNATLLHRYAPPAEAPALWGRLGARFERIAARENAHDGFERGMREAMNLPWSTPRSSPAPTGRKLTDTEWSRFTGRAACRAAVAAAHLNSSDRVALVAPPNLEAKYAWLIADIVRESGARIVRDEREADVLMVGTMSPGPMLETADRLDASGAGGRRIVLPWRPFEAPETVRIAG